MTTSDEPLVPVPSGEVTKATLRKETWTKLKEEGIATNISMYLNRIPNFKGTEDAAQLFAETEEFLKANTISMNADKAQEKIQYHTVQAKKTLLIQIPLLIKKGYVKAIKIPDDLPEDEIKKLTTRSAIGVHGKTVQLSEDRKVDIVVMGSIAVSKQGQRIGKGEGFADIEYAMMRKLGMLSPETIVVTTVHDNQVYDRFMPDEFFKDHDVFVDMIVTPTQVIRVSPKPDRFEKYGLQWNLLSSRRLKIFPILRQLREKDVSAGDTSELKEDSDVEYRPRRPRRFPPRNFRPRPRSSTGEHGEGDAGDEERTPRPRRPRRPRHSKSEGDEDAADAALSGGEGAGTPRRPRRPRRFTGSRPRPGAEGEGDGQDGEYKPRRNVRAGRPRAPFDFSLRVSNIAPDVRVRDLKNALAECKVRPVNIKWRGQNGFALLHFARTGGQAGDAPASVDSIVAALRDLKVSAAEGTGVNVEPMNAVTRIEVTDEITSV